jgi:tetratricopeptide (TPR) repeat protein
MCILPSMRGSWCRDSLAAAELVAVACMVFLIPVSLCVASDDDGSVAEDARAHYQKGVEHYDNSEFDLAIPEFAKAIEADSGYAEAHERQGWAYGRKGSYAQAIESFTRAIELDSTLASAFLGRGTVYAEQLDYDRSIIDFTVAIGLDMQRKGECMKHWRTSARR